MTTALIVIDVQLGFTATDYWGRRNNPAFEGNLDRVIQSFVQSGRPIVVVQHNSGSVGSPLHPDNAGNALVPSVAAIEPQLLVTKSVNSAFYGEPDLQAWLQGAGVDELVVVGIQTNMCVETTARMAGNLGYAVTVPIDATRTFDLQGSDGTVLTADQLSAATAVNLSGGGFATVVTTDEYLG